MVSILNGKNRGVFSTIFLYHLFLFILIGVALAISGGFLFGFYARDLPPAPSFSSLKGRASTSTRIVAADGMILAEISGETRQWVPLHAIPRRLRYAFISVEDARFYEHGALDGLGLLRAVMTNIKAGGIKQGGSTITQQVAKYFMGGERTLDRKVKEVVLALRLERNLSKDEILELYLNLIFLGKGAYGVKAAARAYFNKNLDQLTTAEMALLAGFAQAPSRYSPSRNMEVALDRRRHVLTQMKRRGAIKARELREALAEPVILRGKKDYYNERTPYFTEYARQLLIEKVGAQGFKKGGFLVETTVNPFVQVKARQAVNELAFWQDKRQGYRGPEASFAGDNINRFIRASEKHYGEGALAAGRLYLGVVVSVDRHKATVRVGKKEGTIPLKNMRWAYRYRRFQGVTDRHITRVDKTLFVGSVIWIRVSQEDHNLYYLEQIPRVQSSLHVRDHRTGYIIAMVGGTDFDLTKYNRTVQACRQPGSTYKPIYYSLALARGWSIYKKFSDVPYSIIDPATGKKWRVANYQYAHNLSDAAKEKIMNHKVTLESALVWSRNIPSVTIFQALGGTRVASWAKRFGFTTPIIPDKGLALGASCVKINELTGAFSVFAQSGRLLPEISIKRIRSARGTIFEDRTVPEDAMLTTMDRLTRMVALVGKRQQQAIPAKAAYATSRLLRKVVTEGHNEPIQETHVIVAGKTGTASKTMDTWFSGYTSRWAGTFWLGDEKYERPLGDNDAAHLTTAPAFGRFIYETSRFYPLYEIPWEDPVSGFLREKTPHVAKNGRIPHLHPPKKKIPLAPR
ncbi:transglycosylase domain-containing protein [Myxococcota bacterium]|nr:transglycosylase domain-containing protein [Myxococcota bacterium]MBU1534663.1 transglycosylase domain-containing protein [Myxococcota bacterium]